ncbi:VOC family protein [Curtobacterium luteum]|uniref:VOC family protein n=1 Tax=Curtobacterium luteum TaxID=33881 RepID=UPI00380F709D
MTVHLNPYLGFRDSAREALEFYHSVFGGDLRIGTFREMGADVGPDDADKVMHGQLDVGNGLVLMASDAPADHPVDAGSSISVSLSGDEVEALTRWWHGLSEGATIIEPFTQAPWGDTFGMLTDRFGTTWLVNATTTQLG